MLAVCAEDYPPVESRERAVLALRLRLLAGRLFLRRDVTGGLNQIGHLITDALAREQEQGQLEQLQQTQAHPLEQLSINDGAGPGARLR